jgi:hypothetical protein
MCGRYTLTIDKSTIEKHFGAKFYVAQAHYDYEATYNPRHHRCFPSSGRTAQTASSWRGGASGRRSGSARSSHTR